jgi:hypothetical protein
LPAAPETHLSVPLEPPDQQYWQAAAGYVELGVFLEANMDSPKKQSLNRILLAMNANWEMWKLLKII